MKKIKIIAEAGVNHNGDLNTALEMIKVAANCGVDYIKFQTFISEEVVTSYAKKADYQILNTDSSKSQYDMLKKLELSQDEFLKLFKTAKEYNIKMISTAFDEKSAQFINELGVDLHKIPSGEITNYFLLKTISKFGKPIILSTGMSNINEIESAVDTIKSYYPKPLDISLLHCTSEYPAPIEEVNLKAMLTLKDHFKTSVGYSDHTEGIDVPVFAVAIGASIIEKHFTLDKEMNGPDHRASINPLELKNLVKIIRKFEKAYGKGEKKIQDSEKENIHIVRRSIVAKKNILKGQKFSIENICAKRPGDGISPMEFQTVIGKRAHKNFIKDQKIELL